MKRSEHCDTVRQMIDQNLKDRIKDLNPDELEELRKHVAVLQRIRDPKFKAETKRLRRETNRGDLVTADEFEILVLRED